MAGGDFIKNDMFDKAKMLLNAEKFSQKQIADILGISPSSVNRISVSDTYLDYQNLQRRRSERAKKIKEEKKNVKEEKPVQIEEQSEPATEMSDVIKELKITNSLLIAIQADISYIAEELRR